MRNASSLLNDSPTAELAKALMPSELFRLVGSAVEEALSLLYLWFGASCMLS